MTVQLIEYLKVNIRTSIWSWNREMLEQKFSAAAVLELINAGVLTWSIDGTVTCSLKTPGTIAFTTGQEPPILL